VAHRGFSAACPENTMPAFGAAAALGVDEIELDLWPSADGELVVMHDPTVDRTTDGSGAVAQLPWADLARLDAGGWRGDAWREVRIPRFDYVLDAFAGAVGFNVHIKDPGPSGQVVAGVRDLAERHGVADALYIAGDADVLEAAIDLAPDLPRCCLAEARSWKLVDNARRFGCARAQFSRDFINAETVRDAHRSGIRCNLFYSDVPAEAAEYFALGVDAILTNSAPGVLRVAAERRVGSTG